MKLAAALGIVYVVWGSTYLGIDVAERALPPMLMLGIRFLIAGILLHAWARKRGEVAAERPGLRQWRAAALVGSLLLVVETSAVAFSEKHVPTGLAALIVASVPLFMALLDRAFFGIRIAPLAAVGILAGLAGVGLLAGGGGSVDPLWALVLLVSSKSELAEREGPVPLRSLDGLPLIGWRTTGEPDTHLRGRVADLNVVFRTDDNGTLTSLVAEGIGAAVVPLLVVNPRNPALVAVPLGGRLPPRVLGIVWHRDRYHSAASDAFVELARVLGADYMNSR